MANFGEGGYPPTLFGVQKWPFFGHFESHSGVKTPRCETQSEKKAKNRATASVPRRR